MGLGLLSIPILLHIFKPKKMRRVSFSSLRWLRASQHRLSRRVQWHQILLLALRAVFIAALVLALANPVFSPRAGTKGAMRFVILDVSRSMAYAADETRKPIELGKHIAEQLVSHVMPGDRAAVLLAGNTTETLAPPTADAGRHLARLRSVSAEPADGCLTRSLQAVRAMLADEKDCAVELCFITDNHAQNWSQGEIRRFVESTEAPLRVSVIDVGAKFPQNAWIADARLIKADAGQERKIAVRLSAVGHEATARTIRLTGLPGLPDQAERVQIPPGNAVEVVFKIPNAYDLNNKAARIDLDPRDGLADDDSYWLNLDSTAAARALIVEPESAQAGELHPGFHLRMALEALSADARDSLEITRRTDTDFLAEEIAASDLTIMTDVPSLSENNLRALTQSVKSGNHLVIFLGPGIKPDFYNTKMFDPLHPSASLLPVLIKEPVNARAGKSKLARISRIQWRHPIFKGLFDPTYGDLAQVQFESYYRIEAAAAQSEFNTLAWIGDDTPAIIESRLGAGKTLLFNMTANDAWSDLPRRKSFVPLIDRLLRYLVEGPRRGEFTLGEPFVLPLPNVAPGAAVTVRTPGGNEIQPPLREFDGRTMLRMETATESGIYRVEYSGTGGPARFPFVVQSGRNDSLLLRTEEETLRSWWAPSDFNVVRPESYSSGIELSRTRITLDPWLMILACIALLAEMFFVHRLCPHANPDVVSSSIEVT